MIFVLNFYQLLKIKSIIKYLLRGFSEFLEIFKETIVQGKKWQPQYALRLGSNCENKCLKFLFNYVLFLSKSSAHKHVKWHSDILGINENMSEEMINKSINGLIEVSMFKTLKYHAICIQDLNMITSNILHKIVQNWYAGNQAHMNTHEEIG